MARMNAKEFHVKPPWNKAKVTITRYGPRALDRDNFVGGCKFLIDGLVKEHLIVDDDEKHIEVHYHQHVSKAPRTHVQIEKA